MTGNDRPRGERIAWSAVQRPTRDDHHGIWVRLEPLETKHVPSLFRSCHQPNAGPEFWDYLPYGPFASESALEEWVLSAPSDDPVFFAVCDQTDDVARGVVSLMRIDDRNGVLEIGHVWFCPVIQRSRAATEAVFLLMEHAFVDLGYRRLEWKCDSLNQRSRSAAERYGFTFEGIFRQAAVVKDRNRDTAWFSIIDRDWPLIAQALRRWLATENFDQHGEQRRSLAAVRVQTPRNGSSPGLADPARGDQLSVP